MLERVHPHHESLDCLREHFEDLDVPQESERDEWLRKIMLAQCARSNLSLSPVLVTCISILSRIPRFDPSILHEWYRIAKLTEEPEPYDWDFFLGFLKVNSIEPSLLTWQPFLWTIPSHMEILDKSFLVKHIYDEPDRRFARFPVPTECCHLSAASLC